MAFVLTVLYVSLSLLSPNVLPEAIWSLHVNIILGIATILAIIPQLGSVSLKLLPDSYFVLGIWFAVGLSMFHMGFSAMPGAMINSLPIFIVFYFILISARKLSQLKLLMYVLVAIALFIFLQGWLDLRAGRFVSPYFEAEGLGENRIIRLCGLGVLSDPNDLAQLFVTLIPLLFLGWKKGNAAFNTLFVLVPAGLLAAGMYYTHSRGGAIALLAVVIFGFKDKIGVTLSTILAIGLFAGMMALNISGGRGMNDDDGGRVAAWSTGLELFRSHPLIGVGLGQFADYNETGHTAHNSYILSLSETGLIGYFCWMGTIVANLTGLGRIATWKKNGGEKPEAELASLPPHLRFKPVPVQRKPLSGAVPLRAVALAGPGFGSVPYSAAPVMPGSMPASFGIARTETSDSDENLVRAASVLRVSFVGLLASAFFLSRSFAMIFYILLGMSASIRMAFLARHPEENFDRKVMLKRIVGVLVGSIIFLYLFVRLHGV